MDWQPISTAPTDGTDVLVCRKKEYPPRQRIMVGRCRSSGWTSRPSDFDIHPIAWMPLPDPIDEAA